MPTYDLYLYTPNYRVWTGCGDHDDYDAVFLEYKEISRDKLVELVSDFYADLPEDCDRSEARAIWYPSPENNSATQDEREAIDAAIENARDAAQARLQAKRAEAKRLAEEAEKRRLEEYERAQREKDQRDYERLKKKLYG